MAKAHALRKASPTPSAAEASFARRMVPHHEAALPMAKALLSSGSTDPVLMPLAKNIVASQTKEIETLKGWLSGHGISAAKTAAMPGMDDPSYHADRRR